MKMNKSMIDYKKLKFLEKYNPTGDILESAAKAISASVQHNLLYSKELTIKDKNQIRSFWIEKLLNIGEKFKNPINIATYEMLIQNLKTEMNVAFGKSFDSQSKHGSMFRISHSQKSISVFIKHLWCMNKIEEPIICPVDRIILQKTEALAKKDIAWGYVNSIEEHRTKFNYIENAAKLDNMSVAQWELSKF